VYVIVWEFRAKAGREPEFKRVYGPDGEWAQLFARGEGYLDTELLADLEAPGRYVTIDRWTSRSAFESFRRRWDGAYRELDRRCEGLTEQENALGVFTVPGPRQTTQPDP
jgi:heme-degrading monooxygenase HmoA